MTATKKDTLTLTRRQVLFTLGATLLLEPSRRIYSFAPLPPPLVGVDPVTGITQVLPFVGGCYTLKNGQRISFGHRRVVMRGPFLSPKNPRGILIADALFKLAPGVPWIAQWNAQP